MNKKQNNFKTISQSEQVQKILIGLAAGTIILTGCWFLLISPARRQLNHYDHERQQLQQQIANDQIIIKEQEKIKQEHQATRERLYMVIDTKLVPRHAALGWISIILQELGAAETVEVFDRSGNFMPQPRGRAAAETPLFDYFQLSFNLRGGYHQLGRFMAELEQRLPYAILQNITIGQERNITQPILLATVNYKLPRFNDSRFPTDTQPHPTATIEDDADL